MRKYSIEDRKEHYQNILEPELVNRSKNKNALSNRAKFAQGYLKAVRWGISKNFDTLNKYEQYGQIAGNKARCKARKIKF